MKIVSKAYVLIAILIIAAVFNLFLLYQDQNIETSQSYSIIGAGDVKVKAESISGLATSVARGVIEDKGELEKEIGEVQSTLEKIKNGGEFKGQTLGNIPTSLIPDYNKVLSSWETYKEKALKVEVTSVFDPEATSAMNYVLQKNQELVLHTDQLSKDLAKLDRDYNEHKQIALELAECAKIIGQQSLLISIGEGENAQETLQKKNLQFEIGMRKLLQISTSDLDVESVGMTHEELISIPRENSEALRTLDPLWESIKIKIEILEDRALLSPEFNLAKNEMNDEKNNLFNNIDGLLNSWNDELTSQGSEEQIIIQVLLIVDIAVFILVLFVIRQSLSPLESISKALSKVKEGVYGEKIEYSGTDEVGQLVTNFNIMSNTIKEKEDEAKKTDIAKDEFLAMITHELKTPLVPIQGYSDILLNEHLGKLTDKQKERISIIKSSSETLLSIISDLLDAQKLDLGQLRMTKQNTDVKHTITKAIETLKPEAESNKIEISTNATSLIINHDSERIGQVITNLIKNSIIAIQPNPGKIEVSMYDNPDNVRISIKDNGVGIPKEKQKNLFKKFYQVDATLTRERGGSGLGLAICKGIIDNHLGEITVESVPNQGATFSFMIPKNANENTKSPLNSA
ncbi:two-component sensor histidine kinase [Nitrosopumilus cobalaminigenes]|uniref:histidine kinase n=1 Tax=Nitrosopumilus cobalaminigenes TaxID=1470066 RepID=A0A7D5LYX2_9ARCH|nr:HAMP domain-containing sensor histidine kinase [Nitrosopumilus cobalaminigenes]QLH02634.1 two-component sensor histidine kinase [Nitrosopumilus cobalaminigenes]